MSTSILRPQVKSVPKVDGGNVRYADLAAVLVRRELADPKGPFSHTRKPSQDAIAKRRLLVARQLEQEARELGLESRPVATGLAAFRTVNRVIPAYLAATLADQHGFSLDDVVRTKVGRARAAQMARQRAEVAESSQGSIRAFIGGYFSSLDTDGDRACSQATFEYLKGVRRRFFDGELVDDFGTKSNAKVRIPSYLSALATRDGVTLTAPLVAEIRSTYASIEKDYIRRIGRCG